MSDVAGDASRISAILRVLRDAMLSERAALILNEPMSLLKAVGEKMKVLNNLAALFDHAVPTAELKAELRQLAELNIANGMLVAKRRFEAIWVLRQIGATQGTSAYDAQGSATQELRRRELARA
jgi:hypothetical protein